ncbi:MAG: hypothetical protein IT381_06075 [Deltaproteobacteria bacterium]|nr:hypothetical protein [Deltaproteobacteria bacterium]
MLKLYEASEGDSDLVFDPDEIDHMLSEAGVPEAKRDGVLRFLDNEGLIELRALGGALSISHDGVVEMEAALNEPAHATAHFPPANTIIIAGNVVNSTIQQGQSNAAMGTATPPRRADLTAEEKALGDTRKVALLAQIDQLQQKEAWILFQFVPDNSLDLLTRFYSGAASLERQIRDWQGIRQSGFDLQSSNVQPRGQTIVFGGGRWAAALHADGWFEFAAPFRNDYLGWFMRSDDSAAAPRINGAAFVEATHDVFRFFFAVVAAAAGGTSWRYRLQVENLGTARVELHRGHRRRGEWTDPHHALTDRFEQVLPIVSATSERAAVECLERLYALWGLGNDAIPFVENGAVIPEQIQKLPM